jgi:hypothetical protein
MDKPTIEKIKKRPALWVFKFGELEVEYLSYPNGKVEVHGPFGWASSLTFREPIHLIKNMEFISWI